MTTTTVETSKIVTEEENLTICDECGREVDEAGVSYVPEGAIVFETHEEPMGTVVNDYHIRDDRGIDLCSECADRFDDGFDAVAARVEEWATRREGRLLADAQKYTEEGYKLVGTFTLLSFACGIAALVSGALGIANVAEPLFILSLFFALGTCVGAMLEISRASDTLERLKQHT